MSSSEVDSRIDELVAAIIAEQDIEARRNGWDRDSEPRAPAPEDEIVAAESARGRSFPQPYRCFLARHDGWQYQSAGLSLFSCAELAGTDEEQLYEIAREPLEDLRADGEVPDELDQAMLIGASENDATLILLLESGEVVDWLYEQTDRFEDFIDYLEHHRTELVSENAASDAARARVGAEWEPALRAERDAALLTELRSVLADAKTGTALEAVTTPPDAAPADSMPPACTARSLVVHAGGEDEADEDEAESEIGAEVSLRLVLYLGAQPSPAEIEAAYRAFRQAFPVAGELTWMPAHQYCFPEETDADPDVLDFLADLAPDDSGHFGLRAMVTVDGDPRCRYTLNLRGLPPEQHDDEHRARASFCEVLVPADASAEAMAALTRALVECLPVRSGHAGFAAYSDAEEPSNDVIFGWCRRFFALDVGLIDGWLSSAHHRLRNAAWLTILGPGFATALDEVGRLSFAPQFEGEIVLDRTSSGSVIVRTGVAPVLGDIARGEFPAALAAVDRMIEPLHCGTYYQPGMFSAGGIYFSTLSEELAPFAGHHATAGFVRRLIEPRAFLCTPREQAEALLGRLAAEFDSKELAAWQEDGGQDFSTLMRLLYNATCAHPTSDLAVEALEFAGRYDTGAVELAMNNLLYALFARREIERGLAVMPRALTYAEKDPPLLHNAACIYVAAGQLEPALECVRLAKQYGYDVAKLRADDDLAPLRALPGYLELVSAE